MVKLLNDRQTCDTQTIIISNQLDENTKFKNEKPENTFLKLYKEKWLSVCL